MAVAQGGPQASHLWPRQDAAPATGPAIGSSPFMGAAPPVGARRGRGAVGKLGRVQTITHADPLVGAVVELRSRLFIGHGKCTTREALGTWTALRLGSPSGSGQSVQTLEQSRIIIEEARVPVVVDAGIGAPSDAALAMELGADAVLVNTAIALASDPALMAEAIKEGVEAGRKAYLAGRIPKRAEARPSSPTEGISL